VPKEACNKRDVTLRGRHDEGGDMLRGEARQGGDTMKEQLDNAKHISQIHYTPVNMDLKFDEP